MRKVYVPALALLAVLLLGASPALAIPRTMLTFDFLFSGAAEWDTNQGAGQQSVSDLAVSVSFDTAKSNGASPFSRSPVSYWFFLSDVTIDVDGEPLTSHVPFAFDTEVFVEMDGDNLGSLWIDYGMSEGNRFKRHTRNADLWIGQDFNTPGQYEVYAGFNIADLVLDQVVQEEWGNVEGSMTPAHTPIPGAVWLLGSGLVGLVGLRRKRA